MLGAVCLLAGVVVLALFIKNQNQDDLATDSLAPSEAAGSNTNAPVQFEDNSGESTANNISAGKSPQASRGGPVEITNVPFNDGIKKQIQKFQGLQMKSVMTEAEQNEWQQLLKDGELIRQIGDVLRSRKAMQDPLFEDMQSAAVDIIVQALKQGDENAASEAAWDLIRDSQVEDASIPIAERKVLAGIKGEILYHATAVRPDIFQEVEMDLPGPASQKIWQNVQNQHQDNLKESQSEVETYENEQQQKKDEDP